MFGQEREKNDDNRLVVLGGSAWNRPALEFDPVNGNFNDNQKNQPNQGKSPIKANYCNCFCSE